MGILGEEKLLYGRAVDDKDIPVAVVHIFVVEFVHVL
jgi:hypothetical protein